MRALVFWQFESADDVAAAASRLRALGFRRLYAYAPRKTWALEDALRGRHSSLLRALARALTVGMEDEMVAYWVARAKVNDPDQYKKYTDLVPGILQKFGGRILARGGRFKILEGPETFHRFVVIEFPSVETAVACHASPEYVEAAAHRQKDGASELEIVIVDGIGDPPTRPGA